MKNKTVEIIDLAAIRERMDRDDREVLIKPEVLAVLAHIEAQQRRIEELEAEIERQKSAYLKERAKLREQQSEIDRLRELLHRWFTGYETIKFKPGETDDILSATKSALSERPK